MKKIILILIFMASWLARGQDQYIQLIDSTRIWNIADFAPHGGGVNTLQFEFGDSKTINDTLYFEILSSLAEAEGKSKYLEGYMREDTISRKVFFKQYEDDESILLYDFSLTIGDKVNLYGSLGFEYEVIQLDSIQLIDGLYRRRWTLSAQSGLENAVWVEGMGNITYSLLNSGDFEPGTSVVRFLCCKEKGEVVYQNELFNTCILNMVLIQEEFKPKIHLIPNPTRDYFSISSSLENGFRLMLFNSRGILLQDRTIQTNELNDISHFRNGIYYIQLIDEENNSYNLKIIKL